MKHFIRAAACAVAVILGTVLPHSCVVIAVLLLVAAPAAGQTTPVEATARFQSMHDHSLQSQFPLGWTADVSLSAGIWGVVGEVGRAYRHNDVLDTELDVLTYGAGARWSPWRSATVAPFAQLVVGLARMSSRASIAETAIRASRTRLMLEPAAGVRVPIAGRWAAVGQAGFRRIFLDEDRDGTSGINEITVSAGVRIGF